MQNLNPTRLQRRGGVVVLMALLLPIFFLLAAFVINLAYVQLSSTELMVATDAAARAGGRGLSYYQDVEDAKEAARITAALNTVGGNPLLLSTSSTDGEIEFGDSDLSEDSGRYSFTKVQEAAIVAGGQVANSIRINASFSTASSNGQLDGIFPGMGLRDKFNLSSASVAMQLDRDIALILDRSGSMTAVNYTFPSGYNPWTTSVYNDAVDAGILGYRSSRWGGYYYYANGNNQYTYFKWLYEDHWEIGPEAPFNTLWGDLVEAVDTFLNVLEETDQNEQVSVATYASSASLDLTLETDYDLVRSTLEGINPSGATAIGYGIETGGASLVDQFARPFAAKTIVVMTDGVHNHGTNPVDAATSLASQYDVTIHTVTFGSGADQVTMQNVAAAGGGLHYHADSSEELIEVFEQIANNLPTLITQ